MMDVKGHILLPLGRTCILIGPWFNLLKIRFCSTVRESVDLLDVNDLQKTHGAVFTNPEVVDLILDHVGYNTDKLLDSCRLLVRN